ncbi:MAG: hypothetical protein JO360_05810 [Acidobacteria bacterium]|nr:hypothetical protein [Acidobacteriota bacterium]
MRTSGKILSRALLVLLLAAGLPLGTQARPANPAPQTSVARVEQWLKDTGYQYRSTGTGTWVVNYPRRGGGNWPILVAAGGDFVVVGVVVAAKKEMNVTSEMMFKLLRLSHSLDYVKIGFDDDEDLFVRSEVKTKLLDSLEFKATVDRNAKAATTIYDEIKAFIE